MVANEFFPEFFNIRKADINIRVGGGNDLACVRVADLWVRGADEPVLLKEVRVVPGFGVNIVSGPCLEQKLGMALSSNGRTWEARDGRGVTVFQGPADGGGLYWAKLKRLKPNWNVSRESRHQPRDIKRHQPGTRVTAPLVNEWSPDVERVRVRGEQVTRSFARSGECLH